jgi:sulfide:quinone oxidoreductase
MSKNKLHIPSRRGFLGLMAGGAALATATQPGQAAKVKTKAKIVILGAGSGGLGMANRLANRLDGANITVIDGKKEHWYQPGQTLIGIGLRKAGYSVSKNTDWMPDSADFIQEYVAEIDPDGKSVTTASGKKVKYDYLIVAMGVILDWEKIEGFDVDMIGKKDSGIACCFAGPHLAEKSAGELHRFAEKGGDAVFFRAPTLQKCAGQPMKFALLTEDITDTAGNRGKANFTYLAHGKALISVPIIHQKMRFIFSNRGFTVNYGHKIKAIDHGKKILTFKTPDGDQELGYDFTQVVPPQRAPDPVVNSPLPFLDKKIGEGWVDVKKGNLQHKRYPEVYAIGDIAGVPKGKTAASVKWQAPVIEDHLVAHIQGKEGTQVYNGYTSCPMITRVGKAMLIEFDYRNFLVPSFPGIIAPLEEGWIPWLMKEVAFKATYHSMLQGKV